MVKVDMAKIVAEKMDLPEKQAAEVVEQLFEIMKETLESGEGIKISGFGVFHVRTKRSRRGRNPRTGEEIPISERTVVTFRPSQVLRKMLKA